MEHEPGSTDPADDSAESRITDPEGPASFLDAVRTLVHGEKIVEQRSDSDAWQPPAEPGDDAGTPVDAPDREAPVDAASADPVDWLPGNWVAEPARAPARPGRRRRTAPVPEKSVKSSRGRRGRRTVDPAARRGAPGAEVQMSRRQHPPDLEPPDQAEPERAAAEPAAPPEPPVDRGAARAERRAERKSTKARLKAEQELAAHELKLERKASRDAAAAERAATKERAARRRREAEEQAVLDRAAALRAKAQAKTDRDAAKAAARAARRGRPVEAPATPSDDFGVEQPAPEEVTEPAPGAAETAATAAAEVGGEQRAEADVGADAAEEEQARLDRTAAAAEAEAEAATRAEREAAAVRERADREAAEVQARLERTAAAAAQVEAKARAGEQRRHDAARAKAERAATKAARALDAAESRAEAEQERADRLAEDALATVNRTKVRSDRDAERAAAKAEARIAKVTTKAERRVERATTRARGKADRRSRKAQRRVERAAGKAQARVDRAVARARASADVAETHTRRARELDAEVVRWEPGTTRADESLADHIARVESLRVSSGVRSPRRTAVKVAAVTVVVAACAVVPFVAPSVPKTLADLVPGGSSKPVHVQDPPVDPPSSPLPSSEITQLGQGLSGVRLKAAGPPREVSVPRLHVDSDVIPISGQSGSLLPPSDPQQLGWWREGQPAGAQYGSAVVTGHTVHTGGGALDHLDKLVVGDSVKVRTDAGWIRYVVQRTHVYSTAELARDAKEIFTFGGPGRLVLITCDDWNGVTYESNAVVFAAPVDDQPSGSGGG